MKPVMVDGYEELRNNKLDEKSYVSAFRLQTYIATQFKPNVAKAIYQMTNAKRVLDTSCGWGDRLAVFLLVTLKNILVVILIQIHLNNI